MKYMFRFLLATVVLALVFIVDTIAIIIQTPYFVIYGYLITRDMKKVLSMYAEDMNVGANMVFEMAKRFVFRN